MIDRLLRDVSGAGLRRSHGSAALRRAGLTCFVWVVLFEAFHVYWARGGTYGIGSPAAIPKTDSLAKSIFGVIVDVMFVVGTIVPLALYQRWGRRLPHETPRPRAPLWRRALGRAGLSLLRRARRSGAHAAPFNWCYVAR